MPPDPARDLHDTQGDEIDDENEAVRLNRSDDVDWFIGTGLFEPPRDGFLATFFGHMDSCNGASRLYVTDPGCSVRYDT